LELAGRDGKATVFGTEKPVGAGEGQILHIVATNVTTGIAPHSGHWIMEENPKPMT